MHNSGHKIENSRIHEDTSLREYCLNLHTFISFVN